MTYPDLEPIEIGDTIEIDDPLYKPERARVLKTGRGKLFVEYEDEYAKPRREWVHVNDCALISREG